MNEMQLKERIQGILDAGYEDMEVSIIRRERKLSKNWWQSREQVRLLFADVDLDKQEGSL